MCLKTRMKKIIKSNSLVNRVIHFTNPEKEFEYYQAVGDKIFSRKKKSKHILLDVNKKYLFTWGVVFFIIGFTFLRFLYGDGPSYNKKINIVTVSMLLALTSPFFIIGISYFFRIWKKKRWIIDLENKWFIFGLNNTIPFNDISSLYLTSLQSGGVFSGSKSYQLNLKLKNGNIFTLLKSDDSSQVQLIAIYLQKATRLSAGFRFELA
jgi:hypothetical protein